MVKQYTHSSGSQRTLRRVFEHGAGWFERAIRKPLHELVYLRAVLEVLEQRGNGHARGADHPGSTDSLRVLQRREKSTNRS